MWPELRRPAGARGDVSRHRLARGSRALGNEQHSQAVPQTPNSAGRKKRQRSTSHGKMIPMDGGRGSSLFHLHDPEEESYFKGKQGDLNNAKMLTPVAPDVLFIACW